MIALSRKVWHKTRMFGELVMFSHTLFSLPFAIISMVWAANGLPSLYIMTWSLIALVAARNGANAFNRFADQTFDALNPRTAHRHMPQKLTNSKEVVLFVVVNYAIFIFAAAMLNTLCFILSPVAIILISSYSYAKRFTWLSHLYLGFVIASAPVGAWFAVTGEFAFTPFVIGTIVMLWIAGFDIVYATQDIEFDRKNGLWSIPSIFGLEDSLFIARSLHLIMVLLLLVLGWMRSADWIYFTGIGIAVLLLLAEHRIIKPSNRKLMKLASYKLNQVISMVILFCTLLDFYVQSV